MYLINRIIRSIESKHCFRRFIQYEVSYSYYSSSLCSNDTRMELSSIATILLYHCSINYPIDSLSCLS